MFKYEMHCHSRCSGGGDDIVNYIEALRKKGFSGMVITNHFFRGDTKVDRTLNWAEFIDAYREDYEKGKKIAKLYDFDLLFGIEEHIGDGREVLVYGITPDFLYTHPEIKRADINDFVALVHKAGGLAHSSKDAGRAGIISNVRLRTEKELVSCLKSGNYRILK